MTGAVTCISERDGIEVFDRQAGRYDAWFESGRGRVIFQSEVRSLRRLTAGLPRPWLEVGVGTGRFAEALGIDVGVDPAIATLPYARDRGVRVAGALGQALPFVDGGFATAFVIVTECFADDPGGLLREARRVVTGTGAVVLGIVPAGSPWGRFYQAEGRAGHLFYSRARFFTLPELDGLAHAAGLRFERGVSTLFLSPTAPPLGIEEPKGVAHPGAGFVGLLYRPALETRQRRNAKKG